MFFISICTTNGFSATGDDNNVKSAKKQNDKNNDNKQTDKSDDKMDTLVIILIVIFGVGIVGEIVYFIIKAKNKKVSNQNMNDAAPPVQLMSANGVRGISGEHTNANFQISNSLVMGSDPNQCQIVFQPTTQGISGVHCQIQRHSSGLQLIDNGSLNGTFLNGTKLSPNIPVNLKPGDSFYLGSNQNGFTVI